MLMRTAMVIGIILGALVSRQAAADGILNPGDFLDGYDYSFSASLAFSSETFMRKSCGTVFPVNCSYGLHQAFPDAGGTALATLSAVGYGEDKTVVDPRIIIDAAATESVFGADGQADLIYYFDITNLEGQEIAQSGPDQVTVMGDISYTAFARTAGGGQSGSGSIQISDTSTGDVVFSTSAAGAVNTVLQLTPYRIYAVNIDAAATCVNLYGACDAEASIDPVLTLDATDALTQRIIYSPGLLAGADTTTTAVPEPASLTLLGMGVAGVAVNRRRRRR